MAPSRIGIVRTAGDVKGIVGEGDDRVDPRVHGLDPRQARLDDLDGRQVEPPGCAAASSVADRSWSGRSVMGHPY